VNGGINIGGTLQQGIAHSRIPKANTITSVDTAGFVGEYTSITIGSDGLPVISYFDSLLNYDLKVVKCGNSACNSGNNIITSVDTAGFVGEYTSITIGSDGLPVISYFDNTKGDLKVVKCGNSACNSGNNIITSVDNTVDYVGLYSSITIGSDGLPVISYFDNTKGDLKVVKCGNAACSSGNIITSVDATGYVGLYSSITIGSDGLPVISYHDNTKGDLKVVKCGNAACSSGNIITSVDATGFVGEYTSITIGSDGLPVISYHDSYPNYNLKVVKCGNAACSSGNIITSVDTTDYVGLYSSITIGSDGLPVISYFDSYPNYNLKVVKCGNAACSSGNTITSVDTTDYVGEYSSITIGSDGLPVISYFDNTKGDLKVVKCGSDRCIPYWTRR
jgi:hypothetical protein